MPAFDLNTRTDVTFGTAISVAAAGGVGYLVSQGPNGPDFFNEGQITFTQAPGQTGVVAIELLPGSGISWSGAQVQNGGQFSVAASGDAAYLVADSAPRASNFGHIAVTAGGAAIGLDLAESAQAPNVLSPSGFSNSGDLVVTGQSSATIMFLGDGGAVNNQGLLSALGLGAGASTHGIVSRFGLSLTNSGTIRASDQDVSVQSVAVQFGPGSSTITNHGVISGDIAILQAQAPTDGRTVIITNDGTINGKILLGEDAVAVPFARPQIINTGTINGDVDLGAGPGVFDGTNGTQTGLIAGGAGDDVIKGGRAADALQGNQGDDTLSGGGGDDIVVGGKDNDTLSGDAGDDIVWGNLGNDTLDGGAGNDQVRGGQGDDTLSGGDGNDYISGDRGNDTEAGGPGADIFHSFSGAGIDRVLDFNAAEGDRVMLDPGATYTASQVGGDVVVDMGNGDQLILQNVQLSSLPNGWIFTG